ncbi:MAG: dockerin type I domain-containing protein [Oscillospiraceae bacterium]
MKKVKKLFAMSLASLIVGTSFTGILNNYVKAADTNYGMGDELVSEEDQNLFFNEYGDGCDSSDYATDSNTLPSSVDLSASEYFPEIGDQGGIGSCLSWASTYYQFTYEAHKLNNIVTTNSNAYSPAWTYNFTTNGNTSSGSYYTDVYSLLANQGATTIDNMPYNKNNYNTSWPTDTNVMMEALKTRVSSTGKIELPASGTCYTSNKDSDLSAAKALLSSGKILMVRVRSSSGLNNWSFKNAYGSTDKVAYRATKSNGGHALTVVGYNDNICCDVNGNGKIEASEKGAFKIANSWGTGWGNSGYIWVLYDALNGVSANTTNNWESKLFGTRIGVFDRNANNINTASSINEFFYINVQNCNIGMVGQLKINTNNVNKLRLNLFKSTANNQYGNDNIPFLDCAFKNPQVGGINTKRQYNGTLIFDYGTLDEPLTQLLSGYYYGLKIENISDSYSTRFDGMSFKITDDKLNVIKNFTSLNSTLANSLTKTASEQINLKIGDVNYDGVLDSKDSQILTNYILNMTVLSTLQNYIGDVSEDGVVTATDLVLLNKMIK